MRGGVLEDLQEDDPRQIGRYTLLGRLGSGGMGQVFLGRSPGGRLVAVKIIHPELARDSKFRVRFTREVEAARRVGGAFTAPLIDADPDARLPWLVTSYIDGPSLADAVEEHGPLPVSSVLALGAGLAEGLGAVHEAGVIHRDLKPSNVLLARDGPRLIDFGISQAGDFSHVTLTGMVIGTPGFMSPEQALGNPVGPPSDIFSLGAVLAFAATGEGPYGDGSPAARHLRVLNLSPRLDNLPTELRPLIARCMVRDPAERPSASQFLTDLIAAHPSAASQTGWPPASDLTATASPPVQPSPPAAERDATPVPEPVTPPPTTPAPTPASATPPPQSWWDSTLTAATPPAAAKVMPPPSPPTKARPARRMLAQRWKALQQENWRDPEVLVRYIVAVIVVVIVVNVVVRFAGAERQSGSRAASPTASRTPLPPPTGLTASDLSPDSVTITWSGAASASKQVPDRYEVMVNGQEAGSVPAVAMGYVQTGLVPGTPYQFSVTAVRGSVVSSPSATVSVTAPYPAQSNDQSTTIATGRWWSYGLTASQVGALIGQHNARPTQIRVMDPSVPTFAVTMVADTGAYGSAWWWYFGETAGQVGALVSQNNAELTSIDPYQTSAGLRFAVVMVPDAGAQARSWWYYGVNAAGVGQLLRRNNARLIALRPYLENGLTVFAVIMVSNTGADYTPWQYLCGVPLSTIASHLNSDHMRPIALVPDPSGGWDAILVASDGEAWYWWYGMSAQAVQKNITRDGTRLIDLSPYYVNGKLVFATVELEDNVPK
jgi:serine/threonine protein kinase